MNIKKTVLLEISIIFLVLILLFNTFGNLWDKRIKHEFPYGYLATDTYQHQTRAQWIKEAGNYRYEGEHYSGNYTDVIGFYPPIIHHVSIILSNATNLEVYDTIYFFVILSMLFGVLLIYFIAREFNVYLAILSIPLVLFIFVIKGSWVGFLWGHWPAVLGDFFLLSFCFMLSKIKIKKSYIPLAITLSGTALSHTASTIFAGFILIFYCAMKFWKKELNKETIITLVKSIILFLIISGYFLFLFQGTWMHAQPYKFRITTQFDMGGGFVRLIDFQAVYYIILPGLAISTFFIKKNNNFPFFITLSFFILGLTNYIGFGSRAFNLRFYWPISLAISLGIVGYLVLNLFPKKIRFLFAIILSLSSIFFIYNNYYSTFGDGRAFMSQELWDMYDWIKNNLPENANIFYFYGDSYDQFAHVGNTNRLATRIEFKDYFNMIASNRTIARNVKAWLFNEHGAGLPYKKSLLQFGYRDEEDKRTQGPLDYDLCEFKYFVIDKLSRIPEAMAINQITLNKIINTKNFEKIYENKLSVILKNNKQGGECIEV
ncbi:hypothetical protein HYV79_02100 [Candidatus Woesearchaeota archaeon]|nr:hypothetical protein [Candidatus Woesearchaeota archaeon]